MSNGIKFDWEKDEMTLGSVDVIRIKSPGRVNLIGEHTDYNLGLSLPCAIDKNMEFLMVSSPNFKEYHFSSVGLVPDLEGLFEDFEQLDGWGRFVYGAMALLKQISDLPIIRCYIKSDIPVGAGLSSSAALSCGLITGMAKLCGLKLSKKDVALLAQKIEHVYVGVKCGLLDQYAILFGKKNYASLIDFGKDMITPASFRMEGYKLLLVDTMVSHNLASSEYNLRRESCLNGLTKLQNIYPSLTNLGELGTHMLSQTGDLLDPETYKRLFFVTHENQRVVQFVKFLEQNDLKAAAGLLFESHYGLSEEYEVSCEEADFIVTFAKQFPIEILGARMVGGGFGGCVLHIIANGFIESYLNKLNPIYEERYGLKPGKFEVFPSKGLEIIS